MKKEYYLIDISKRNNSWRLEQEIKDSNCKVIAKITTIRGKFKNGKNNIKKR